MNIAKQSFLLCYAKSNNNRHLIWPRSEFSTKKRARTDWLFYGNEIELDIVFEIIEINVSGISVASCVMFIFIFFKHNFVSSHMYPENPEGTQVIVGSMNMGYISDTARNRTHDLFRPKREAIPLGHSDGRIFRLYPDDSQRWCFPRPKQAS